MNNAPTDIVHSSYLCFWRFWAENPILSIINNYELHIDVFEKNLNDKNEILLIIQRINSINVATYTVPLR